MQLCLVETPMLCQPPGSPWEFIEIYWHHRAPVSRTAWCLNWKMSNVDSPQIHALMYVMCTWTLAVHAHSAGRIRSIYTRDTSHKILVWDLQVNSGSDRQEEEEKKHTWRAYSRPLRVSNHSRFYVMGQCAVGISLKGQLPRWLALMVNTAIDIGAPLLSTASLWISVESHSVDQGCEFEPSQPSSPVVNDDCM